MTTAVKVGDRVRYDGYRYEVVLGVTSTHAFVVSCEGITVIRAPLSELTLVESAPSEPGKSTDLLYGWERCSHEGIGKPGCSTCDPDKSRCVAKLERDLAQRDATIAELVSERDEARKDYAAEKVRTMTAKLTADTHTKTLMGIHDALHRECSGGDAMLADEIRALRAKSEQRREALQIGIDNWPHSNKGDDSTVEYVLTKMRAALSDDAPPKAEAAPKTKVPTWDELVAERDALKVEVERLKAEGADCAENHYSAEEGRALETENDKLRDVHSAFNSNNIQLRAENAKLREALQAAVDALEDWNLPRTTRPADDLRVLEMAAALGVKVTS